MLSIYVLGLLIKLELHNGPSDTLVQDLSECIDKVRVTISKASPLCLFCLLIPWGSLTARSASFLLFCATNQTRLATASTNTPTLNTGLVCVAFLNLGGSFNIDVERTSPKVGHGQSKPNGSGVLVVWLDIIDVPCADGRGGRERSHGL